MGMVFEALAVTADQARAVRADPELAERLLFGDDDLEPDGALGGALGGALDGAALEAAWAEELERRGRVDLDKSWHGIHYLLTGTAWDGTTPLGMAVLGGDPVGEDGGYGPPRLLEPAEVRAVAAALEGLDLARVRAAYDPQAFRRADIYPDGIWEEEAVLDDYLMPYLTALTRFYARAAADGKAVLAALA